jgi:hypothetical protein
MGHPGSKTSGRASDRTHGDRRPCFDRKESYCHARWEEEDRLSEENKAVVRRWVEAVDELLTDSYVRHDPNSLYRLTEGKIDEQWVNVDTLGMMQQLGVVPAP